MYNKIRVLKGIFAYSYVRIKKNTLKITSRLDRSASVCEHYGPDVRMVIAFVVITVGFIPCHLANIINGMCQHMG